MAAVPDVQLHISTDTDIVRARQAGRKLAEESGFSLTDLTLIATAISEVARNITNYAGEGELSITVEEGGVRRGIVIIAADQGPGIPDVERALEEGYSTGRGLGLGLPGARRVMDEFSIDSRPGRGTTVTMRKWLPRND
jgi:serine/threonine-protein kinase RsbT